MYKATVNNNQHIAINESDLIEIAQAKKVGETSYEIIINDLPILAHISMVDLEANTIEVKINNNKYTVVLKTPADLLVENLGITIAKPNKASSLKSPMPGMILKLLVQQGAHVKKGENLIILEAMKMENVFKAPTDAVVKAIQVQAGQAVEKGQELITFE
jgi:biotin carboxyl carrier protein